jgi:peroxiredoxin
MISTRTIAASDGDSTPGRPFWREGRRWYASAMFAIRLLLANLLCFGALARAEPWKPAEGLELLGTRAPPFRGIDWLQGGPLTLEGLGGRAVLLRFWLVDCSMCRQTAPALNELWETYGARGLTVVAIHHPKSEDARDPAVVRAAMREYAFRFPVGIDQDWNTVRAYGVGTHFRRYTSVSILIDRHGVIRFVHDGGKFHRGGGKGHERCNRSFEALREAIEKVLAER